MSKKVTLKTFSVGVVLSVWFDKEVKANTSEEALKIARDMEYCTLVKDLVTVGHNDSHWDVMQVSEHDVLEKHGF